jgi:hypothetical protein
VKLRPNELFGVYRSRRRAPAIHCIFCIALYLRCIAAVSGTVFPVRRRGQRGQCISAVSAVSLLYLCCIAAVAAAHVSLLYRCCIAAVSRLYRGCIAAVSAVSAPDRPILLYQVYLYTTAVSLLYPDTLYLMYRRGSEQAPRSGACAHARPSSRRTAPPSAAGAQDELGVGHGDAARGRRSGARTTACSSSSAATRRAETRAICICKRQLAQAPTVLCLRARSRQCQEHGRKRAFGRLFRRRTQLHHQA